MAAFPYSRCDVATTRSRLFDDHNLGPPITNTERGRPSSHPLIVITTSPEEQTVTGVLLRTFNKATSLAEVSDIDVNLYKWYLPIIPATKESIYDPIPSRPGSAGIPEWVVLNAVTIPVGQIKGPVGTVPETTVTAIEAAITAVKE